jgi:hypothetical protein
MLLSRLFILLFLFTSFSFSYSYAASVQDYLPTQASFDPLIPLPKQTLGFEIGQRHVRHDQLRQYFSILAQSSKRIKITTIGQTPQLREQFLVTISNEKNLANLANLDDILVKRNTHKKNHN